MCAEFAKCKAASTLTSPFPLAWRRNRPRWSRRRCASTASFSPWRKWKSSGLLGGFKGARNQKKIDALLDAAAEGIADTSRQAYYWLVKTQEMAWTQADVLQIMEEIEHAGVESMVAYYAARHNLELLYNRLIRATLDSAGYPASLLLINRALCDLDDLVEAGLATSLVHLSEKLPADRDLLAWLRQDSFADWQNTAPASAPVQGLADFLGTYGHRTTRRGGDRPAALDRRPRPRMRALFGCIAHQAKLPARTPFGQVCDVCSTRSAPSRRSGGRRPSNVCANCTICRAMLCTPWPISGRARGLGESRGARGVL